MKWHKVTAGLYTFGEWTATREEQPTPGYVWFVHHPDITQFYTSTLREAARMLEEFYVR